MSTQARVLRALEAMLALQEGSLTGDSLLSDLPKWDSMKLLEFILFAERAFGITLDWIMMDELSTVGDLLNVVVDEASTRR